MKVRVNEKSISAKLEKVKELADEKAKDKLTDIASYIVAISPVDTGAYMLSHSVVPSGFGGGRLRTSRNKPRHQDYGSVAAEAMAQLRSDIEALDLENTSGALFRNRAVHAPTVETGSAWAGRDGYWVYTSAKDKFG